MSNVHACCQVSQRTSTGSEKSSRSAARPASAPSAARACPSARAEVSSPAGSDCAGLRGEISAWARKQVSLAHPNVFQDDLGRARGLQRGQLERRADGQARPVDRQGDQHLPPVVQERTGDQDVPCARPR